MAAIPQMADAKWLNQFKCNAAKSSGECRKKHREKGEAERERMTVIPPVIARLRRSDPHSRCRKKPNKKRNGGSRKTKREIVFIKDFKDLNSFLRDLT